jgi:hypothetical protein
MRRMVWNCLPMLSRWNHLKKNNLFFNLMVVGFLCSRAYPQTCPCWKVSASEILEVKCAKIDRKYVGKGKCKHEHCEDDGACKSGADWMFMVVCPGKEDKQIFSASSGNYLEVTNCPITEMARCTCFHAYHCNADFRTPITPVGTECGKYNWPDGYPCP